MSCPASMVKIGKILRGPFDVGFVIIYTKMKVVFGYFFKTSCHCERVQRAKQSAKHEQNSVFFLAENSVIARDSAKIKKNRTRTWQIASLVALVRNDSLLKKIRGKKYWFIRKPLSLDGIKKSINNLSH